MSMVLGVFIHHGFDKRDSEKISEKGRVEKETASNE
jgi:hypothetical protein